MSIRSEFQRLRMAKQDFKDILGAYGNQFTANSRTEDMPPMIVGMPRLEIPYVANYEPGWVNAQAYGSNATFTYENPNGSESDIYILKSGHQYMSYVCVPGTRYRVMYCTLDPTKQGKKNVSGKSIVRRDNPPAGFTWTITGATPNYIFTAPNDCYLIIQKDNTYNTNIRSYLIDVTFIDNTTPPEWVV